MLVWGRVGFPGLLGEVVARSICIEVLCTVGAYIIQQKATYYNTKDITTNCSSIQVSAELSLRQSKLEFLRIADPKSCPTPLSTALTVNLHVAKL